MAPGRSDQKALAREASSGGFGDRQCGFAGGWRENSGFAVHTAEDLACPAS